MNPCEVTVHAQEKKKKEEKEGKRETQKRRHALFNLLYYLIDALEYLYENSFK